MAGKLDSTRALDLDSKIDTTLVDRLEQDAIRSVLDQIDTQTDLQVWAAIPGDWIPAVVDRIVIDWGWGEAHRANLENVAAGDEDGISADELIDLNAALALAYEELYRESLD